VTFARLVQSLRGLVKMSRAVVRDIGWIHVKADAMNLSGYHIDAGLFADSGEHDGVPLAQIGFWLHYGTEHIPARPWLEQSAAFIEKAAMKDIEAIARRMGRLPDDPQILLKPLADAVAEGIKSYTLNHPWRRNAVSTIRKKGFNWPLVDSGEMVDAISARVGRYGRTGKARG
jgi:hypothetical protein